MGRSGGYPPHRKLSLEEKIEIIKEFERTKTRSNLAKLFYCHVGQINRTLQHKIEIVSEFRRIQAVGKIRKKRSACKVLQAVGTILNEFVQRCRYYPIQLNDEFLLIKAKEIASIMNLSSFKGHNYWLKTFKRRFKLNDVNWDTWGLPYDGFSKLESVDLETIIEDLRAQKGESVIPLPTKMDEMEYEKTVREMISNSVPYPGYLAQGCTEYNNNEEITGITNYSDDDYAMSNYDGNSNEFDPTDFLTVGDEEEDNSYSDDPMTIDSYQTALSYFRPLAEFILSKSKEQTIHMGNQLGNALVKAAETEEEDEMSRNQLSRPLIVNEVQIEKFDDAVQYLQPLEEFVLSKENMRAVGLINQLEILLKDESLTK